LNASPKDKAHDFVETFKSQMPGPMIFMMAALVSLVLAAIVVSYTTYNVGILVCSLLLWIAGLIWLTSIYMKVFKMTELNKESGGKESVRKEDKAELARVLKANCIIGFVSATEVHLLENFEYTDEIHTRLSEYYNLIGVVSALIAGMAFGTFVGPPDMSDEQSTTGLGLCLTISSLAGVLSSLLATVYYALINLTPPALCKTWAIKCLRDLGKPLILLVVSVGFMGLSMLVMTEEIYGITALVLTILMCEFQNKNGILRAASRSSSSPTSSVYSLSPQTKITAKQNYQTWEGLPFSFCCFFVSTERRSSPTVRQSGRRSTTTPAPKKSSCHPAPILSKTLW